jgi:phage-related protein
VTGAYDGLNLLFNIVRGGISIVSRLVTQWIDGWKSLWNNTKDAWNGIKNAVVDAWNATVAWLSSTWTSIKTFFVDGWHSLTSTVSTWYTNTKNAILGFPAMLKQYLVDSIHNAAYNFGYAVGSILRFILDLPGKAMNALKTLKDGVVNAWNAVVSFLTETVPALARNVGMWLYDMWHNAIDAVQNFVSYSITTVSELPGRIGDYITQTRDRAIARFNELRDKAVERVRNLVSSAREEAAKLPGQISNAISSVVSRTYDIGRDMVYGMINGIKNAAHALWDAARSVVMDAWQGAKDALQSKSPSKKWAELGHDSAAGYQVGFDGYDLTDSITTAVKMPLDAFSRTNKRSSPSTTQVSVGGAQMVAYLQIGDDQLRPVVVTTLKEHPQEVALAAQQGDTQLARRR